MCAGMRACVYMCSALNLWPVAYGYGRKPVQVVARWVTSRRCRVSYGMCIGARRLTCASGRKAIRWTITGLLVGRTHAHARAHSGVAQAQYGGFDQTALRVQCSAMQCVTTSGIASDKWSGFTSKYEVPPKRGVMKFEMGARERIWGRWSTFARHARRRKRGEGVKVSIVRV